MKKTIAVLLTLVMLIGMLPTFAMAAVSETATVALNTSVSKVEKDGTFTVTVSNTTKIEGTRAMSFALNYDKDKVSVSAKPSVPTYKSSVDDGYGGTEEKDVIASTNNVVASGSLRYLIEQPEGGTFDIEPGAILTVTFKGNALGEANFSLSDFSIAVSEPGASSSSIGSIIGGTSSASVKIVAPTVPVTGVSVENLSLNVGETQTLSWAVEPGDATNKTVTFTSNNTDVATVDNDGKVTANSEGKTTITVTAVDGDGKYFDTCTVTVSKQQPTYTVPTDLTATYGDLLSSVALPKGWTWEAAADATVGNKGTNTFKATFTPENTNTHAVVTGIEVSVEVAAKSISDKTVTIPDIGDQPYTGGAIEPKPYVKDGDTYLKANTDFTYSYKDNAARGTATVTITGMGNYTGTVTKDFEIVAAAGRIIISGNLNVTYGATVPDVTVEEKTGNGDVTVYYYTNEACTEGKTKIKPTDAGTYYVKAELAADENYGDATSNVLSFTIAKATNQTYVEIENWTYGETANKPEMKNNKAEGAAIAYYYKVKGAADSTYTTAVPTAAGDYTVKGTVAESTNYRAAESTMDFKIEPASLEKAEIGTVADQPYTGSEIKPEPSVTVSAALTKDVDFIYSYEANTYVGTATVKITGKGNYTGTASKTFAITPVNQNPAITATASVTKGGYTVDLKPLVTNAQGTVSFEISGEANGCTITDGVLTSGADTATVKVTVKIAAKNVDDAGADEYNAYTGTEAIAVSVVNKKAASLTVTQADGTYGQTLADPNFTAPAGATTTITYTGTQKDGTAYNSSDKPTQAGDYTVAVKCETDTHIYDGSDAFKIEPKKIAKPTAPSTTYTYNGKEQTYALATNDAYTITGTTAATNASSNSITVALKDKNNTTWADGSTTDIPFTFEIKKATITVKADDIAIKVNETVPAATYTVTGLVNGETLEGVTAAIEGTVDNTKEGQYTIKVTGPETLSDNYNTISYVDGTLTISNKNTVITPVGPKPQQPTEPTQPEEPEVTPSFGDIAGEWFEADVKYVAEKGLMNGVGDGSMFAPLMNTSRGMIVTILWRMEGQPVPKAPAAFTDVEKGAYYEQAVAWASENGIVNGYGATFGPNDNITREQFATILFRYAQYKGLVAVTLEENLIGYADHAKVSAYAVQAMNWAVGKGLINGIGSELQPAGAASRAQAAAILHRFCENVIQ